MYTIVLENGTDQAVVVYRPDGPVPMRPCSVIRSLAHGSPLSGVVIRAENGDGRVIYSTRLKHGEDADGRSLYVRIPPEDSPQCPTPASTYMFTVWNQSRGELEVWTQDVRLGGVDPRAHETFGPLPGTWREAESLTIRGHDGKEAPARYYDMSVNYDLGQVPEISIGVH